MSSLLATPIARAASLAALVLVGCATTSAITSGDIAPDTVVDPAHATLPSPSDRSGSSGSSGSSGAGDAGGKGTDGGATPTRDAGASLDAAPPPPPPPPPQICANEAGVPWAAQTECGCDKDCAAGLTCAQVGGLAQPWCCAPAKVACADDNDCCGQLLCVSGACQ
jgi:hypothetical protein